MATILGGYLMKPVRQLAKTYMFNSTLDVFREALAADSTAEAAEILIASASRENGEFWMDVMILAAAFLTVILLGNCFVRMFCWICIGVPQQAIEIERMRRGELPYQVEARKAKEEKKRRQEAGLEEKPIPLAEDMKTLMAALSDVRGRLSAQGIDMGETVLPAMHTTTPEEAAAAKDEYKATKFRYGSITAADSVLRGFPEVDILRSSPSQRYLLVSCRSKRLTLVFPQGSDADYLKRGKELTAEVKSGGVSCVEKALTLSLNADRPPEVYSAAFTPDDSRVVVGERNTDQIFAFTVSGANAHLSLLWSFKMPNGRLVSTLPRWNMMNLETLISVTDKDCEVETIAYRAGGAVVVNKEHFKVGNATAWSQVGDQLGVSGSFLREPRLARVVTRANTGAMALETISLFSNPLKLRVTALALVVKGVPNFNTRSYFITFLESGECKVFDVDSLSTSNTATVCASFTDTDFAGHDAKEPPLQLFTCISGKSYQERLLLGIYRGREKIAVYRQNGNGLTFAMDHLTDIFGPQEGATLKDAVFIQNGKGIATCGNADGRQVRFFSLPA